MESSHTETTESVDSRPRNPSKALLREKPRWLIEVEVAKARAFDALSDVERAEAKAAQTAARERSKARKENKLELARRIFELHDAGQTAQEIGAAIGRSGDSVRKFARALGVSISRSVLIVRMAVTMTADRKDALARIAADRQTTLGQALEDLITFALDEDGAIARRILHVRRRTGEPK